MEYTIEKMFGVKDKVIVVTGGTRGIGMGLCEGLASLGAKVIATGSSDASAEKARREFAGKGIDCEVIRMNVAEEKDVKEAAQYIIKKYGRIDGLVNNAGIQHLAEATEFDIDEFNDVFNVNVTGIMRCAKHFAKYMLENNYGRIVNVSSVRGSQGKARYEAYAASKGAVNTLTKALACEFAEKGITVNAVAPCFTLTDITRHQLDNKAFCDWAYSRIPMRRLCEVSDLLGATVYLLSDIASFITGVVIPVDGGWLAG